MTRVNKYISFDNSTITRIEEYQKENNIEDFSSAVEKLILRGFEK